MNKKLQALLQKKTEARAALVTKSEASEDITELRGFQKQIKELNVEIDEMRAAIAEPAEAPAPAGEGKALGEGNQEDRTQVVNGAAGTPEKRQFTPGKGFIPLAGAGTAEDRAVQEAAAKEKRGKDLKEGRSVTIASDSIVIPNQFGKTINGTFQQVSSLIDNVNIIPLAGGESFRQPYEMDTPDGNYTAEGVAAADTDRTFGYADISKTKITAYSEITNEVAKLPAANYADLVMQGVTKTCRKKIAKEILIGDGATGHFVGIFSSNATAIDAATDISIATIDNTTLDTIVFGYGGDEAVEGTQSVLILNKVDLAAFSRLRTNDGKKFHDIKTYGGYGTIDSTPFIINSVAGAVSKAATVSGTYCMAYGNLSNYMMAVFSQLDVQRSTDYKFKEGMIAHRGEVFIGGNVTSHNGFLRIKKS